MNVVWIDLEELLENRLNSWKGKQLSIDGRLVLIKCYETCYCICNHWSILAGRLEFLSRFFLAR
jgi:hypothetical protein